MRSSPESSLRRAGIYAVASLLGIALGAFLGELGAPLPLVFLILIPSSILGPTMAIAHMLDFARTVPTTGRKASLSLSLSKWAIRGLGAISFLAGLAIAAWPLVTIIWQPQRFNSPLGPDLGRLAVFITGGTLAFVGYRWIRIPR